MKKIARRVADVFPFTPLGLLVLAGCSLALFYYGIERIDLVLLVIGSVGLGLGAIVFLVAPITGLILWLSLRKRPAGDPLKLECGFPARTGFTLSRLRWVPFVQIDWKWVSPESVVRKKPMGGRWVEEIVPVRRGLQDEIVRRFEVSDSFGFTRVAFQIREERAVRFIPSVGALKTMHVVRSISGGSDIAHPEGPPEGDRIDMRHYVAGDPIRFVLWKVFARSRQLIVRTPERAISPVRQTVAYLVTGEGDEPAAGAARVAVDSGVLGGEWVFGADGNDQYAKSTTLALELLARSAKTDPEDGGDGLSRFLDKSTPGSIGRAIVFVPGKPGPWLDKVAAAAKARASSNQPVSPVEFIVCTDGISRPTKTGVIARYLKKKKPPELGATEPAASSDVAKVIEKLGAARARVMVVDRVAGRVFAEGHRRSFES